MTKFMVQGGIDVMVANNFIASKTLHVVMTKMSDE